jgi:hypothetical protein
MRQRAETTQTRLNVGRETQPRPYLPHRPAHRHPCGGDRLPAGVAVRRGRPHLRQAAALADPRRGLSCRHGHRRRGHAGVRRRRADARCAVQAAVPHGGARHAVRAGGALDLRRGEGHDRPSGRREGSRAAGRLAHAAGKRLAGDRLRHAQRFHRPAGRRRRPRGSRGVPADELRHRRLHGDRTARGHHADRDVARSRDEISPHRRAQDGRRPA